MKKVFVKAHYLIASDEKDAADRFDYADACKSYDEATKKLDLLKGMGLIAAGAKIYAVRRQMTVEECAAAE